MAFPTIVAQPTHASAAAETQWTITWPSVIDPDDPDDPGPQRGDLLVIIPGSGHETNGPITDAGDGDLRQFSHSYYGTTGATTNDVSSGLWYKRANGDEAGTTTQNVALTADPGRTVHAYVIRGADEYTAPDLAVLEQTSAAANPNPPSNTAAWGSDDNQWIAHVVGAGTSDITGTFTGYSDQTELTGNATTGSCRSAAAWRDSASDTEDPSALTRASFRYIAQTIAVRPRQATNHAKLRHYTTYETDGTFPNDVTVVVEGGNSTVLLCGIAGASLDSGSPVLTLDPGGPQEVTLVQCSDGVTSSHIGGTLDLRLYRVPASVPAGSYTLRGSRSSGSGSWSIYWAEFGDCSGVLDVANVTGTASAAEVSGTIDGASGALAVALVFIGATTQLAAHLIDGVPPMGLGEVDNAGDTQHSNLYVGRLAAGSNSWTFDNNSGATLTAIATVVSLGYAPANQNAPFLAAAA